MLLKDKGFVLVKNIDCTGNAGSHNGMSYTIREENGSIAAYVYPHCWALDNTAPEYITRSEFSKDNEGCSEAINWINSQYEADPKKWEQFISMTILATTKYHK